MAPGGPGPRGKGTLETTLSFWKDGFAFLSAIPATYSDALNTNVD